MRWNDVPDGASLAMSKETAMEMRGSRKAPFITGVICGVVLTISLQSCGADDNKTTDKPSPGASVSNTHKPGN
jgi:hypothetical protein